MRMKTSINNIDTALNTSMERYTRTAMGLHWAIALLIFIAFPLGLYMHDLHLSPLKLKLYSWHKWIGITVFLLVVLRVLWRTTHRPPALPDIAQWQRIASHITHMLLYALMIAVPLSGWLMSSAKGFQTVWFGVLPIPDLIGKDRELGKQLATVHALLNYTMLVLVATHIAAALKHHFIDRDSVLRRMLPFQTEK